MLLFYFALCLGSNSLGTASNLLSPAKQVLDWSGWGGNHLNNHWASWNHEISSSNIRSLTPQCNKSHFIGVSATPVISGHNVYYPTWNGSFIALDYITCQILWQINVTQIVSDFSPLVGLVAEQVRPVSRTSPQVDGAVLYFGTLTHALVVAVDRFTGKTLGAIQLNPHPFAIVTMSPTFYEGRLYVGAASVEENLTLKPTYPCCSFVGNIISLSFDHRRMKFKVHWNVSMIPESQRALGWSGAPLWGSQPSIDTNLRQVFVATGNSYSVPNSTIECQKKNLTTVPDPCLPSDIWQESIISINIDHGTVNWVHQLPALDAFTAGCGYAGIRPQNTTLCPEVPGLDSDFGMAPTFVPGSPNTHEGRATVVVGQKNGILYGLSAEAGELFWASVVTVNGIGGGLSWGVAADDQRVYFTAINSGEVQWRIQPSNEPTNRSAYGAVSLTTGAILWETLTPFNGVAYGPPTIVDDLILVARTGTDPNGTKSYDQTAGGLVVLEKKNGNVVLDYALDSNFHGGVAVQDNFVLFGTGYSGFTPGATVGGFHVLKVDQFH